MKKAFLLIACLLSIHANAQVNVDSLYTIWNDETQADTNRLKAIDELCYRYYLRTNLDSAKILLDGMLALAKQKELKKYEADALHLIGIALATQGDSKTAIELSHESLKIREEIKDEKGIGRSLANIGSWHANLADYKNAGIFTNRALRQFQRIEDRVLEAHTLHTLGRLRLIFGDLQGAANYMSEAIRLLEGTDDLFFLTNVMSSLCQLYSQIEDYKKGIEYGQRTLNLAKQVSNKRAEVSAMAIMGISLDKLGKREEGLQYMSDALTIATELKSPVLISDVTGALGHLQLAKGNYPKALEYYFEQLDQYKILKRNGQKSGCLTSIGKTYLLMGSTNEAIKWCKESLDLAEKLEEQLSISGACKCLYEAYKEKNDGITALEYHEIFLKAKDSMHLQEVAKDLQRVEYEKQILVDSLEQEEQIRLTEIAHQEEVRQKNRTRNMLAGGGLFLFLIAGGIYSRLRYVRKSKATLQVEKDRSENLLLNILPKEIAEELKEKGRADARDFDMVSILFTDFKGFTAASEKLSAQDLVTEINVCFEAFDRIMGKYGIEKIKTIGDAYMAAGGLPIPTNDSVKNTVLAALEMQAFISKRKAEMDASGNAAFKMRVGIHTGPVVAGIVGVKKFQYDIWGDTVNTASRMESNGKVGKVNISHATYDLLKADPKFIFESRGKIEAKGKGEMEMYFVSLKMEKI